MLLGIPNWEWGMAIIAVAAAVWSKIRWIFSWLSSWFVVTNQTDASLVSVILGYLNSLNPPKKRKQIHQIGYFNSETWYVRPLERTIRVCYRVLSGRSMITWYRNRPIWYLVGEPDESSAFSFIRWTVDWPKLLQDAVTWEDEHKQREQVATTNRYEVYKIFGSSGRPGDDDGDRPSKSHKSNSLERQLQNVELLHWEKEDIGEPRQQASLDNLSLDKELEDLIDEAKFWRQSEQWYKDRGIIWRRSFAFNGPPGCIDGETFIKWLTKDTDGRRQNNKGGTLKTLYHRFNRISMPGYNGYPMPETENSTYSVMCMSDEYKLVYREIAAVLDAGVKHCLQLTTSSGLVLICTDDHPVATPAGFTKAGQLAVGDPVMTNQHVKWCTAEAKKERSHRPEILVKHHPHAATKIIKNSSGAYAYKRITRARAVYDANLNRLTFAAYIKRLNDGLLGGLVYSNQSDDIHHIDENPANDVPENLVAISHAEHARQHILKDNNAETYNAYLATEDKIVSVEPVGDRQVYDIRMKDFPHNFLANNFVVHNSGKTSISRGIAEALDLPVYCPDLATMDNEDFNDCWSSLTENSPCMVLIEDIDGVFHGRENMSKSPLTFDCILNCLDGAKRPDGVLMILTTNHVDKLDPALIRPGRVDRIVKFKPVGLEGKIKIAKRILGDDELARTMAMKHADDSPAEFQETCFRMAIDERFADRQKVS
jgi:hypothetical protein